MKRKIHLGGRDLSVTYLNSILYGEDVCPIIKQSPTIGELCISLIEFFVITAPVCVSVAAIYNWFAFDSNKSKKTNSNSSKIQTSLRIFVVAILFISSLNAVAQITNKESVRGGIYLTLADFHVGKLTYEIDCSTEKHKIKLHDFTDKSYIDVIHDGKNTRSRRKISMPSLIVIIMCFASLIIQNTIFTKL